MFQNLRTPGLSLSSSQTIYGTFYLVSGFNQEAAISPLNLCSLKSQRS